MVSTLADHLSLASLIVARVRERMATGEEQPTVRDGLAAIRLLAETEAASEQHQQIEDYVSALVVGAVRDVMPAETYTEIGRRLAHNPVLRSVGRDP